MYMHLIMASFSNLFLTKLFLIFFMVDTVHGECGLGWIHWNNSCYLFSSDAYNWLDAQISCRAHNARLAEPKNKMQSDYLISIAISIGKHIAQAECALGWIHYGDSCYLFSSDSYDWFTAQSSCHEHNAKLAEPANKSQTDYLINMAYIIGKGATYWLGGRDDVVEGTWQWSSSDNIITYKPWSTGQPDNYNGIEDCLEIWCFSANCNFNDGPCTIKNHFICERRYPGPGAEVVGK